MKIAVIGAGFTGLTTSLRLAQKNHTVALFEKEAKPGGLATGFHSPQFSWSIEKHYHHLFTNDHSIIGLIKEIGLEDLLIFPPSLTSLYHDNKIYPFNTPFHILQFTPLSLNNRLRLAFVSAYLKLLPKDLALNLEKETASSWLQKYYGQDVYRLVWQPLLQGKFGKYKDIVNMSWFWARIKKRTFRLGYIKGGFQKLADLLDEKIKALGVNVYYNTSFSPSLNKKFDKIIVTTPTSVFLKMFPTLPTSYINNLKTIPHLHALNLLIISKKQFFPDGTYWLNINDRKFPFIAVVEHTNFIDSKYYGGNHLLYVGNYLPPDHPYLKMKDKELLNLYLPYLQKINPNYNLKFQISNFKLFLGPFAQPVFPTNYSHSLPSFQTPLKNVYLANLDMVYPWDRGTNYAVELGNKVAELVDQDNN
ncbi:NAD(P)/FAD-dependent oxidoreductase [Candidatus Gottesmanbacteria bacterium]|nr:NAD(P)/FAD-dependent oxidoreductase [Candidatus Gottesmanbacteria bacterium]